MAHRRAPHPRLGLLRVAALALLLLSPLAGLTGGPVRAQDCDAEREPNNVEAEVQPIEGPFCVSGELPTDDQDLFLWTLDEEDAATPLALSVAGIPGTVTTAQLYEIASEPGVEPAVAGSRILALTQNPEEAGPVTSEVILRPGRYLLGISRTQTADGSEPTTEAYTLQAQPGEDPPRQRDTEPNDDATTATEVERDFALSGSLEGSSDAFAWSLSAEDAERGWELHAQGALGAGTELSLLTPENLTLATVRADELGRAALYDLALAAGTYIVRVGPATEGPSLYTLRAVAADRPQFDVEPNNDPATAGAVDLAGEAITGRLAPAGDIDHYRLAVDETLADSLFDIKLIWRAERMMRLCLIDSAGTELQCKDGQRGVSLANIALPRGDYTLRIAGDGRLDDPYLLRVDATVPPVADFETEPNDQITVATEFDPTITMRGVLDGVDDDYFRVPITGEPQLWLVQVEGTGVGKVAINDASGTELASGQPTAAAPAQISDLYLTPGDHWVRVSGTDGDYTVTLTPLGPPAPNGEREANNDAIRAEPFLIGQERTGRLVEATDADVFRFSVAALDHLLITVTPPEDATIDVRLEGASGPFARLRHQEPGVPLVYDALLQPGDYVLWLTPTERLSTGTYAIAIERKDPFDLADDQEPNGTPLEAQPLPTDRSVSGTVGEFEDSDWYALPPVSSADLEIVVEGDNVQPLLTDGVTTYELVAADDGVTYTPTERIAESIPLYLQISGTGQYEVSLTGGSRTPPVRLPGFLEDEPEPPVAVSLTVETAEVAAYWEAGQRVEGELTLVNEGEEPLELSLLGATSHYAWSVETETDTLTLEPGQSETVPVRVRILPDAWANVPVQVTLAARDGSGATASASVAITPTGDAPAVNPEQAWTVPEPLRGGLDVAALSLGATVLASIDPAAEDQLHDGVTPQGAGFRSSGPLPVTTSVDLAGDAPLPIAGFILNPQGGDSSYGWVRGFELLLSTDGVEFTSVHTGELQPLPVEQAVVLEEPVEAGYARLVITSVWADQPFQPRDVILGEWKVIAAPGATPEPNPSANIASGALGGHIVLMEPQSDDLNFPLTLVDEDPARWPLRLEPGVRPRWVLGFHHDRAALVTELQWVDPTGSNPEQRFTQVQVEVSRAGPLGPWEPAGTWELERAGDGSVAPFVFDEPVWARFIRFTGDAVGDDAFDWEYPATLRAIEQAATDEYRSILGEWGAAQPQAIYELLEPPSLEVVTDENDAPDTAEDAAPLTAGEPVIGRAQIGEDVDWYSVTVPDDQNTLTFTVTGLPAVDVVVSLFDAGGEPVVVTLTPGQSPSEVTYEAAVEPGATYTVKVEQPQHSIAFAFDTSASMGPYFAAVMQALRSYSAGVQPGQEFVNALPFEDEPLLEEWTDDPYRITAAVNGYRMESQSSSAEIGILDATRLLASQDGAKAILLITDAETSSFNRATEMWQALAGVGPRIFAVHIGATDTHAMSQDFMQDWAIAADGHYGYIRTQAELDRAFDRAATWLRRPAAYGLSFATSQSSTEPGSLRLVSPKTNEGDAGEGAPAISTDVAIEIIFDTSGSMLGPMPDGQRRIDVARTVLSDLVTNQLPAGVPVALRVFGTEPGSCETSLAVPLQPLDPGSMAATIQSIEPVNEVKTPIGASLEQVASDLEGVEGPKIVVLVTDGEETCGGDPAAAIQRLMDLGIDVQVNIVGFALDDEALKREFRRWARIGQGSYFDATNAAELDEAIAKAVQPPFRVYDEAGELVESGTVDGASVRLPPGAYRVVVLTDPETVYEEVVIRPEEQVTLTLGEEPPELAEPDDDEDGGP